MSFAPSQSVCASDDCEGATVCFEIDPLDGAKAKPRCMDHALLTWCENCALLGDGFHYEGRICRGCGSGTVGRREKPVHGEAMKVAAKNDPRLFP